MAAEPLTYNNFINGAVFFHKTAPKIQYYLNAERNTLYDSSDKSYVCMVTHINDKSFLSSRWHLNSMIKQICVFSEFVAYTPPEE